MPLPKSIIPSQNLINALVLLLPLLLSSQYPFLRIPPFTPRQLIYSRNDYFPLLLAPWAWPRTSIALLSRITQAGLLYRLPGTFASVGCCYVLWILVGLVRLLIGFLLTRSVGWAHPRLFRHYALYETTSGLGSALVVYLALTNGAAVRAEWIMARWGGVGVYATSEDRAMFVVGGLCAVLSWLDGAPWTYAVAMTCVAGLAVLRAPFTRVAHSRFHHQYHPMDLENTQSLHPDSEKPQSHHQPLRTVLLTTLITLLLIYVPSVTSLLFHSKSANYLIMPSSPHPPSPLLEILILSHPRPGDVDVSSVPSSLKTTPKPSSILYTTINSYLPYISTSLNSTRLSIFTHTLPHPSFTHARQWFSPSRSGSSSGSNLPQNDHTSVPIEFYVDEDTHADSKTGQYLHLAEALRWAWGGGNRHGREVAEWVLLVEDDFALCGEWGWEGVVGVMRTLEGGRKGQRDGMAGGRALERLGGFVGTGGRSAFSFLRLLYLITEHISILSIYSGLIIHRTFLPILSHILHIHASLNSPLPSHAHPRPADLIIQDCLLGLDPLCPKPPGSKNFADGGISDKIETGGGPLVITSKLVMEHIGSRASTAVGRVYQDGKWACGWRHPFHGREEVDVVVV